MLWAVILIFKRYYFFERTQELLLQSGPTLCRSAVPLSRYTILTESLMCGTQLPSGPEKRLILDSGMIHLMVVSGLHLVFIENLLIFLPNKVRLSVLACYCYFTGFEIPVLRAFLRRILNPQLKSWLALTNLQCEAFAVLLALVAYPPWIVSRSFLMSWIGGIAISLPMFFSKGWHLERSVKAYVLLLPFCWSAPLTILWNALFAPLVGWLLFPASLASLIIHRFAPITDFVWGLFLQVLSWGPCATPWPLFFAATQLFWIPPIVHVLCLYLEVRWRRAAGFS